MVGANSASKNWPQVDNLVYYVFNFVAVLDLYANTPPLETLMDIPTSVRRTQLLKVSIAKQGR